MSMIDQVETTPPETIPHSLVTLPIQNNKTVIVSVPFIPKSLPNLIPRNVCYVTNYIT